MPEGNVFVVWVVDDGVVPATGDAAAVESVFFGLNHACPAGEGEAAEGDPVVVAVAADFFECLCLAGVGEAPGLALDVAAWVNTDDTENAVNAMMREISFFMAQDYQRLQYHRNAKIASITGVAKSACNDSGPQVSETVLWMN